MKRPLIIIFLILVLDQWLKFWIKTTMCLGCEHHISEMFGLGDWFIIHFTENKGMAFGMEFEGDYGKLFLSIFRIVAVTGISWYLWDLVKKKSHPGLIISVSMILAGAFGNIIDSAFYGLLFSESGNTPALFLPPEGGYETFLHGKVVDMLYFPLFSGFLPDWFPIWGGEEFVFFRPVFNIADSSITIGVCLIILFQRRFFIEKKEDEKNIPGTEKPAAVPASDPSSGILN
jgi:signal peptidase II